MIGEIDKDGNWAGRYRLRGAMRAPASIAITRRQTPRPVMYTRSPLGISDYPDCGCCESAHASAGSMSAGTSMQGALQGCG